MKYLLIVLLVLIVGCAFVLHRFIQERSKMIDASEIVQVDLAINTLIGVSVLLVVLFVHYLFLHSN